jgi:hypothetical protein
MRTRLVAAAMAASSIAAPAQAHHSMAMFDLKTRQVLSGTVREFQWTNPHCYVQVMVRNAQGKDEEWSLEMAAPAYLQAKGWKPRSLKPGDKITVTFFPLRSGKQGGMLDIAKTADGRIVGVHS